MRSAEEVIRDHLEKARKDLWKEDLALNFAEDCVLLTSFGVFRGHSGIQEKIDLLHEHLPDARYEYRNLLFQEPMGFLEWTGDSDINQVDDGADSYLVQDGRITVMTIHYTPSPKTT